MGRDSLSFRPVRPTSASPRIYAYFAGFLDGEGCFEIHNSSTPRVSVTNTYPKVLRLMQAWFGGRVRQLVNTDRQRPLYQWSCTGLAARNVCAKVLRHLGEKAPQASILLQFADYPPRSEMRTRLISDLKALKRIRYETHNPAD